MPVTINPTEPPGDRSAAHPIPVPPRPCRSRQRFASEPQADREWKELAVRLLGVGAAHRRLHFRSPDVVILGLDVEARTIGRTNVYPGAEIHAEIIGAAF